MVRLNRVLDVMDPLRIIGREPPLELSEGIMRDLSGNENGRTYRGIFIYHLTRGKIVRENLLNGKCVFYEGNGKRAFF